jgi:uncharacterized protein YhaN
VSDTEELAARLHDEVAVRQQAHDAAAAGSTRAQALADAAREELKAAEGVGTVAEARALAETLTAALEKEAAGVRRQLAAAGGTA